MIATTAMNLSTPQAQMIELIEAGEAEIEKLTAKGEDGESNKDCGVNFVSKKLGKKSECDKISEKLEVTREKLANI